MLRSLRSTVLSLLPALSLSLLFAAGACAAPVMTFSASSSSTGIANATETQWRDSTFIESGERYNFTYALRDEVVVENGVQYLYHYRDVSYDVDGQMRDWVLLNVDGTASGAHTVQFSVAATLDTTQTARLAESGDQSFQIFLSLDGNYAPGSIPEYPDLEQPPAPPVFADTSAGAPQGLAASTFYFPDQHLYTSSVVHTFTAPLGEAYDFSYLIQGNADLLSDQAALMLHGPGYDAGVRTLGYSEFLGAEPLPVPEPGIWMMMLAGAGVLALSRHSRSIVFRN